MNISGGAEKREVVGICMYVCVCVNVVFVVGIATNRATYYTQFDTSHRHK